MRHCGDKTVGLAMVAMASESVSSTNLIEEIEARLMILLHLEAIFEGIVEAEAEAESEPQRREDFYGLSS
nr:hypothetical protein Itr_chr15CG01290 [Ipomoea trifida]